MEDGGWPRVSQSSALGARTLLLQRAPTRFRSVLASRSNNSSAFQLPRAPRKLITFTATSSAAPSGPAAAAR